MKRIRIFGLALLLTAFFATSALALTANYTYTVQLMSVSATGQQTALDQMSATTDANGKLSFQFSNVPDDGTTPFLMVEIIDPANGQQQTVRQTLVPAPTSGQQMQMGVNEANYRQTQAALQAMQGASSTGAAALRVMFPMTMIPSGAISTSDADSFGQAAGTAATTFQNYLTQNGVTATQMNAFQNSLLAAMRTYAAASKNAVDQTNATTAAGLYGQAGAQLMTAMITAAQTAGIDPTLVSAAFDQAGQAAGNSTALAGVPTAEMTAMQASFQAGAAQRQLLAQMNAYASAMPVVGATSTQTQTFTTARTSLQTTMQTAMQSFYQNAFANQTSVDPTSIDQALTTMQTTMQTAFSAFTTATTATSTQLSTMFGMMATGMNGMMGSGGSMMNGTTLQTSLGSLAQNWSTMMVAASNLATTAPNLTYTPDTTDLTNQLMTAGGTAPTAPDWSQIPDSSYKSLLELRYDLMLVHLIDVQLAANATTHPLTQDELASISATDLANRTTVLSGLQGLTTDQMDALTTALTQPQMLL